MKCPFRKKETIESRLQAENERLKGIKTTDWLVKGISKEQLQEEKIQALTEEINRLQAENERLKELLDSSQERYFGISNLAHEYRNKVKTAKAEAYKEVLNFLESRFVCKGKLTAIGYESAIIDIKNFLK